MRGDLRVRDVGLQACRGQPTRPAGRSRCRRRDGRGQRGAAHEVRVDGRGGRAALGDRPDDERLAAAGVTGDEHARDGRSGSRRRARRCRGRRRSARAARSRPPRSGPVKPIAISTRSAGISRSRAARRGTEPPSTDSVSATRSARTSPASSPRNSTVETGEQPLAALLVRGGDPEDHRVASATAGGPGASAGGCGRSRGW